MSASLIREVVLSRDDAAAVGQWASGIGNDYDIPDADQYDRKLAGRLSGLPAVLREAVGRFARTSGSAGVLHLRGLPVSESLPPTPAVAISRGAISTGTEPIMLAVSLLVGQALSIKGMRNGDRVHNIYPMPDDADTQKASNSVRLELHTEMAFQKISPDALALICLRASKTPPATSFCDMRPHWDALDETEKSLLMEPAFGFRYTDPNGEPAMTDPQPVVTESINGLQFQYDNGVKAMTPAHEAALKSLRDKMDRSTTELTLAAGDLTLIDNRHVVHGRSPMAPTYGGGDRWLQRCLLMCRANAAAS